jgi:hypothetical protein
MNKAVGPWTSLAVGIALLGLGVLLMRANPWARAGAFFLVGGLVWIVIAFSTFRQRGRNARRP